jgi:hypothetical protein
MSDDKSHRPTGMKAFSVIWAGQLASMLGSGMTRFALTIWAWQITGSATALALIFVILGIISALIGLGGCLFPAVRQAEDRLPDHTPDLPDEVVEQAAPA